MRPMPPNANQMTSMITMQQPVHATTTANVNTSVAPATNTTSGGQVGGKSQTASNLKQQQQQQQIVSAGGQRTALKLSNRPPAHAQQADQQQQQQQWHQSGVVPRPQTRQQSTGYVPDSPSLITSTGTSGTGPPVGPHRLQQQQQQQQPNCPGSAALECSAISGLTTTTTTTTSQATGAPHERPDLDPADEDPSECSCSNSFECSLDEPTHSTSSHLEEPLLGPGGGGQSASSVGGPAQQMLNHYPHAAHHHHHHHQHRPLPIQQQHHNRNNQQQQQHHHHHDIYNQHHRQHHHQPVPQNFQPIQQQPSHGQYHKSRDLGGHPSSGHHYHPQPVPLYGGPHNTHNNNHMQQQLPPSLPSSANDQHQHRHRPLMPHASMPPVLPSLARAYINQSPPPPPLQPTGPHPAPLVRHSTYAVTSDTITDESLQQAPPSRLHRHQSYANNGLVSSPPLSPSAPGPPPPPPSSSSQHATGYHYPPGPVNNSSFNETELVMSKSRGHGQQSSKREISFRRSATTREDDDNRWHRGAPQAAYSYNSDATATRTLPLERQQSGGPIAGSSSSLQRSNHQRSTPRLASGHNNNQQQSGQKIAQRRYQQQQNEMSGGNFQYQDNGQQQHTPIQGTPALTSGRAQSVSLGPEGEGQATGIGSGSHSAGGVIGGGGGPGGNLLMGSNPPGGVLSSHSVSPFEAAATFCPPIMAPPPPLPPIGPLAITSHRTNSPWMRLSSIILTPVGIVIVLFIVVSPLLHYLM